MKRIYVEAVTLENYRGFSRFSINGFKRINILGGLNAGGKSSLLEGIFWGMDARNPANFTRASQWRGLPATISTSVDYIFHNGAKEQVALVELTTRDGTRKMETTYGELSPIPGATPMGAVGDSTARPKGISQVLTFAGRRLGQRNVMDAMQPGSFNINEHFDDATSIPDAVMLSRRTLDNAGDAATRFTKAAQARHKRRIVKLADTLVPSIANLELLQVGEQAFLHAELKSGALIPLSFAGDGAATAVGLGLAIMHCQDGVVLVDEFEGSVHFSRLFEIWRELGKLSSEFNCQLFVATHSRECIAAAVKGLEAIGRLSDLNYIRLDRVNDATVATSYTPDQLSTAMTEEWEVR